MLHLPQESHPVFTVHELAIKTLEKSLLTVNIKNMYLFIYLFIFFINFH